MTLLPRHLLAMAAALGGAANAALSQETLPQLADAELPPVVVEGATIEAKPAIAAKPKASPMPSDVPAAPHGKHAKKKQAHEPQVVPKNAPATSEPAAQSEPDNAAASSGGASQPASTDYAVEGLPASKIGSAVSVVTGEQLKAQQVRNAADALRSLPGVSVSSQGTPGNLTVVRIRGAESNHTLVLIDGVEVNANDNDGFFDFSNLMTEEIAQIEVLRGPQSGLYGSGAIGGVINIITKSGKGPLRLSAMGEGGSFGTKTGAAQISGGTGKAYGSLTVQSRSSDGFNIAPLGSERDAHDITSFAFRGGVAVFDNLNLDGSLRFSHRRSDRDGFDGSSSIRGLAIANDDLSTLSQDLWTGRIALTHASFEQHWINQIFATRADDTTKDSDATFFSHTKSIATATDYGYTSTLRIDESASPIRHFLTGRIEQRDETFEQPTFGPVKHERGRTSATGEVRGEYFDQLFLSGTLRQDWNEVFDDTTTWHAAASLTVPGTPLRLHASTGTGVKYPSFSEQFGFFFGFTPNPDLKPETSFGWDAGAEFALPGGKAVIDVTYFDQNLNNEITTKFLPNFQSTSVNLDGESTRRGIEVSARALLMPGVTAGAAYTFLDAEDDKGQAEIRRPRHTGKVDLSALFFEGRANLNLAVIYNGEMKDLAFQAGPPFGSSVVTLDHYWLVNLAASYKVQPGVEIFGRVENLLDQHYQEVFGFNTAGIAAYGGVRITFEEPSTLDWAKYK